MKPENSPCFHANSSVNWIVTNIEYVLVIQSRKFVKTSSIHSVFAGFVSFLNKMSKKSFANTSEALEQFQIYVILSILGLIQLSIQEILFNP